MAKFLVQASYTAAGVKGLAKEGGSSRLAAVKKATEGLGGTVESFYYAFGPSDAFVVLDVPDAVTAAAVSIAVNATGGVNATLTPLLTVEDIDAACKKTVAYRAPGA